MRNVRLCVYTETVLMRTHLQKWRTPQKNAVSRLLRLLLPLHSIPSSHSMPQTDRTPQMRNSWQSLHSRLRYRKRSFVPGKRIYVLKNGEKTPALALDIDAENHLLVRYADGREEALSTGEVSIRIHEENV